MRRQQLPGYPGSYLRKILPPFLLGALLFIVGVICLIMEILHVVAIACIAAFIAVLIFMIVQEYRNLLPRKRPCPACGKPIDRLDEGAGTEIHYDCKACKTRWETGLSVPDS